MGDPFEIPTVSTAVVFVDPVGGNDSTGRRGSSDFAFATLNGGAAVLQPGDVFDLGCNVYAAPCTVTIPEGVKVRGAKMPRPDSLTAPTKLIEGCVVPAPFYVTNDNISLEKIGFDGGSAVCTALYAGNPVDALAISNVPDNFTVAGSPTGGTFTITVANLAGATATTTAIAYNASTATVQSALTTALATLGLSGVTVTGSAANWLVTPSVPLFWGIASIGVGSLTGGTLTDTVGHPTGTTPINNPSAREVVTLAQSPTSGTHSFRCENVTGAQVETVRTYYGTYGFVAKAIDSDISDVVASGAGTVHIYFKSDAYALCHDCNASNLIARAIGSSGTTAQGIAVDGYTAAISNIQLANVDSGTGIQYGMEFNAVTGYSNVSVSNADLATGILWQNGAQNGTVLYGCSVAGVPAYSANQPGENYGTVANPGVYAVTTSYATVPGMTQNLNPGTYLINVQVWVQSGYNNASYVALQLYNTTASAVVGGPFVFEDLNINGGVNNAQNITCSFSAIVTLSATGTIALQAIAGVGSTFSVMPLSSGFQSTLTYVRIA